MSGIAVTVAGAAIAVSIASQAPAVTVAGQQGPAGPYVPTGAAKQVLFVNAAATGADADSGYTYDKTTGVLTLGGKTVTASAPALQVSQTWNNLAVAFSGAVFNFTDTASAAASKLLDLQLGGVSKFAVQKDGSLPQRLIFSTDNAVDIGATGASRPRIGYFGTGVNIGAVPVRNNTGQYVDLGGTGAGGLRLWQAYTSESVNDGLWMYNPANTGWFLGTITNGAANTKPLNIFAGEIQFQTSGNNRWKFDTNGHLVPFAAGGQNIGSAALPMGLLSTLGTQTFYGGWTDSTNNYGVSLGQSAGSSVLTVFNNGSAGGTQTLLLNATNGFVFSSKIQFAAAGHIQPFGTGGNSNAFDLGTSSFPFRTGYFGTSLECPRYNMHPAASQPGLFMDDSGGSSNSYLAVYRLANDWVFASNKQPGGVTRNITFNILGDDTTNAEMSIKTNAVEIGAAAALRHTPTTSANLPAAATAGDGARAFVTDATLTYTAANLGAAYVSGGTNKTPVVVIAGAWVIG